MDLPHGTTTLGHVFPMIHLTIVEIAPERAEQQDAGSPAASLAGTLKEAKTGTFACPVYVNFKKNRLARQNEKAEG